MEQESAYLAALEAATQYGFNGPNMELSDDAGTRLVTFRSRLVVNPRDEVLALDYLDLDAAEAHVEAFVSGVEHLVAGLDTAGVRGHRGHDPRTYSGC